MPSPALLQMSAPGHLQTLGSRLKGVRFTPETGHWLARPLCASRQRIVDFHIDYARIKLGVATRTEAAIKAATWELIKP